MAKTEEGIKLKSLAFRTVPDSEGLHAPQMLLIEGNKVVGMRTGVFTTLGHAIAAADDLLDGWAFSRIEVNPEDYYEQVML